MTEVSKRKVKFEIGNHRQLSIIKILFDYDESLIQRVKNLKDVQWSQKLRCWYVPDTESNRLKFNLEPRIATPYLLSNISKTNQQALRCFLQQLQLKGYSASTIRTYRNEFAQLLQTLKEVPVDGLSQQRLRNYFVWCHTELKLSENTIHSRLNAVKFYFEQVLRGEKFYWDIPRPKKPQLLPKVLGENELGRLFRALKNKKHKAMLYTAYSCGLRVSEIAALQIKHIDSDRMQIFISRAKGKKDRYVNLSPILLDILRDYIRNYTPTPSFYLFESDISRTAYPPRTIQRIFSQAKSQAGIKKDVGIHSLRHSFATHLLEKGTDVKYIKELLGHFNIKTTERYLHITKNSLLNIASPLDDLYTKGLVQL